MLGKFTFSDQKTYKYVKILNKNLYNSTTNIYIIHIISILCLKNGKMSKSS